PPDMVEREHIGYSDHENVGAEADFNNLETSITVSPILTSRIHNAHPISQIIGNLNKKDERGIVVRNKVRIVAQGHTQEKGIDYEEVFAPVERIEAIRLFLAYASFMGFMVYQMDVKSAFLYGTIEEEVIACFLYRPVPVVRIQTTNGEEKKENTSILDYKEPMPATLLRHKARGLTGY
nr:copia protein [Tanacetum cinerariifolium]